VDERADGEQRAERKPERAEAAGGQRDPAEGGAEQVAELVGRRAQ
jgi:hypothetical protein